VQHAHQLGVIHRDLKPSNILVDSGGQPHLLDFGLAKEILSDSSPHITLEEAPGTPAYMSPEQAAGKLRLVGTSSDVYTLGAILYLLLLKRLPHDISGTSIEVMNRIATQDPVRPRDIDASISRDLQAILLKALAREPEERYSSADELSADIQHLLDGRPISPLRNNRWYVSAKFVRRHRYKLLTALATLAVVVGVTIVSYVNVVRQRNRAETNETIATEVNKFLLNMLASADPEGSGRPVPSLPELLDRAAARIDGAFPDQPLVEAAIRATIGKTYVLLAFADKAETHHRRAYELRVRALGASHPDTLDAVGGLAQCLYNDDRHVEAENILRPAIASARKNPGIEDARTLDLLNHLAATLYYQLRREETAQIAEEIYRTNLRVHGPDDLRTVVASESFATALTGTGRHAEAEKLIRDAMKRQPADPDLRASRSIHTYLKLGAALAAQGKLVDAEDAYTRCVEARVALYGPKHNMVAYAKFQLANTKESLGKGDEAEKLILEAIDIDEHERPDSTAALVNYMCAARLYRNHAKPALAAEMLAKGKRIAETRLTAATAPDPGCIYTYGNGLVDLEMYAQADDYLTRAIDHASRSLPPDHAGLVRIMNLRDRARAASTQPATAPQN
jgi:tetratricopeptide (TPR) repeat protein